MHADKTTARQILGQGGDYLLQVKSNQPTLHKYAKQISKDAPLFFREKKWENRYFITSLVPEYSHRYAQTIREHWGIESRLHWRKDAILREDETRCRDPWTVSNLMLLRNLVIHFYEHTHQEENLPAWVQVNQRSNRHLCRWMMRKSWGK
ncbi:MAG: transposase [Kiritimatiellia bacterium]